jgi:adenosine deaminase
MSTYESLKAKVLSFPFSSFFTFRNPGFLEALLDGNQASYIKHEVFNEVQRGMTPIQFDSFGSIIKKYWLSSNHEQTEELCLEIASNIANEIFEFGNNGIIVSRNTANSLTPWNNLAELATLRKQEFWIYFSKITNLDVISAVFLSDSGISEVDQCKLWDLNPSTSESLLDNILDKGMAETHLHQGASSSFLYLWTISMSKAPSARSPENKPPFIQTYEGALTYAKFSHYVIAAKIIRMILVDYLFQCEKPFAEYLAAIFPNDGVPESITPCTLKLYRILDLFNNGGCLHSTDVINTNDLLEVDKWIIDKLGSKQEQGSEVYPDDILHFDPIFSLFPKSIQDSIKSFDDPCTGFIYPEQIFIIRGVNKLKDKDLIFSRLFWQYSRIKSVLFSWVTQNVLTGKGLEFFTQYYYPSQGMLQDRRFRSSESIFGYIRKQRISKLELRISAPMKYQSDNDLDKQILVQVKELLHTYNNLLSRGINSGWNRRYPQIGIVYHFIKRGYKTLEERAAQSSQYYTVAQSLARLRSRIYGLDHFLVGIDAASQELPTDPSVFRDAYHHLRKSNHSFLPNGIPIQPIGFTFHVGEDFRDICTGLRHIDEAIDSLGLRSADRLGHAIALGICPQKWATVNDVVVIPIFEYIANLIWTWGIASSANNLMNEIASIEWEIHEAIEIACNGNPPLNIRGLYKDYYVLNHESNAHHAYKSLDLVQPEISVPLKSDHVLSIRNLRDLASFPQLQSFERTADNKAHSGTALYSRGSENYIEIRVNENLIDRYQKIQAFMKEKVSRLGIVVEVNPTSNLSIGNFPSFSDYYAFNLSSPSKETIILTINTDDPIVFNTSLASEFAIVYNMALEKDPQGTLPALRWIDQIRENGLRYSFIKDSQYTASEVKEALSKTIKDIDAAIASLT